MELSKYAQQALQNSTHCHMVHLTKNNVDYLAIYNGFEYWGVVEDGKGGLVDMLVTDMAYPFSEVDFILAGYQVKPS